MWVVMLVSAGVCFVFPAARIFFARPPVVGRRFGVTLVSATGVVAGGSGFAVDGGSFGAAHTQRMDVAAGARVGVYGAVHTDSAWKKDCGEPVGTGSGFLCLS